MIILFSCTSKTKKDSKNSSKPPSQTEKDESFLRHPGSNGKGKNENKAIAKNTRVKETVTISEVRTCDVCGEDLTNTSCIHRERRTKIDIVFEKVVEHIDAEVKQCPGCDSMVKGQFPSDMHESSVLLFAKETHVSFTNNRAERDLRMSKEQTGEHRVGIKSTHDTPIVGATLVVALFGWLSCPRFCIALCL